MFDGERDTSSEHCIRKHLIHVFLLNWIFQHVYSIFLGQFLVNDDHTCEFLNECEVNNGGCSHKCHYKKGVLSCSCPNGFELDNDTAKVCIDQNECLTNNGGCAHHCDNLNGTHVCRCNAGYQLASDKYGCLDVDECIDNNGNCSNICINLLGSYTCACEAGYELKADKHTCHDIGEPIQYTHYPFHFNM